MTVTVELILSVDPAAVARAQQVAYAIMLMRGGSSPRDARRLVRERYTVSAMQAWRIVGIALDVAGPA